MSKKHMSSALKHLTLGALLLALCGGCFFTYAAPQPSVTESITGPSTVGRAIPFAFDLPESAREFSVDVTARRSCGAGALELVLDGVTSSFPSTSAMSATQTFDPGMLGATTTGTLLVVEPSESEPVTTCGEGQEVIHLTVTVRSPSTPSANPAHTPTLRVETEDGI